MGDRRVGDVLAGTGVAATDVHWPKVTLTLCIALECVAPLATTIPFLFVTAKNQATSIRAANTVTIYIVYYSEGVS